MPKSDVERAAEYWSKQGTWIPGRGLFWAELPAVQQRLNCKASGKADVGWVQYTLERHFAGRLPLGRCLVLGCGEGGLERALAKRNAFAECDALDIAQGSIAKATELARQAGYEHINYTLCDVNAVALPARYYDAVWAAAAVHHFERLEHVFDEVATSLKPGGLFILHEYVGPNRFQFPARQRQVIEACFGLLPSDYRRLIREKTGSNSPPPERSMHQMAMRILAKLRDGDLLNAVWRRVRQWRAASSGVPTKVSVNLPTPSTVRVGDPSEAVRSADIMPLLQQHFDIAEFKPLGGTILQFLLADIAGNFEGEMGQRWLDTLFIIEDLLLDSGDLASDFAYIVAAPKGSDRVAV